MLVITVMNGVIRLELVDFCECYGVIEGILIRLELMVFAIVYGEIRRILIYVYGSRLLNAMDYVMFMDGYFSFKFSVVTI